jgi:hypothetical protein
MKRYDYHIKWDDKDKIYIARTAKQYIFRGYGWTPQDALAELILILKETEKSDNSLTNLPKVGDKIRMKKKEQQKIKKKSREVAKAGGGCVSERKAESIDATDGVFTVKQIRWDGTLWVEEQPWPWKIKMFEGF